MATAVGTILEFSLNQKWLGQNIANVWQYRVDTLTGSPAADEWGEAWWDEVKTLYRGIAVTPAGEGFLSVLVKDITDPLGIYGEFTVPAGEIAGTRNPAGLGQGLPSFTACGVRLAVATRATKPGQKRFAYMYEEDNNGNQIQAAYLNNIVLLMQQMSLPLTLAAPAAGCVLQPVVVSKGETGLAVAEQDIVGFAVKTITTSQVSRRSGHGP